MNGHAAPRTSRRRLFADAAARYAVTLGGWGVIVCILGMVVFIAWETLPLFGRASVRIRASLPLQAPASAVEVDEYRTHLAVLGADGLYRVHRLDSGAVVVRKPVLEGQAGGEPPLVSVRPVDGGGGFVAATGDGRAVVVAVRFEVSHGEGGRVVTPSDPVVTAVLLDPARAPLGTVAARLEEGGGLVVAGQRADGGIAVAHIAVEENPFTGEIRRETHRGETAGPARLRQLLVGVDGRNLYGVTGRGELFWWEVRDAAPVLRERRRAEGSGITAAALLLGGRSLVVGQEDGTLGVWFPVTTGGGTHLVRARDLGRREGAVRLIVPGSRDKTFFTWDDSGMFVLQHATSERLLWSGRLGGGRMQSGAFAPKGDGAVFLTPDRALVTAVRSPHPEVSWRTLFGRVWYEGYPEPAFVWQSTGGTDQFEPKLSLTPLVFGTIKGTVYALFLAVPLGVFGAIYASHFMHPSLRERVKPVVEIMAALPSVVLGFLAGLWLAPRLERHLMALFLVNLTLPPGVILAGMVWTRVPARVRNRWRPGAEMVLLLAVVSALVAVCVAAGPAVERTLLGTAARQWVEAALGLSYDQRNAVVVGLAMGFAVIPIVFAIAEDALTNVPNHLVAGSLALGATRWQTVTRVVLPTASPGIFSAVIVGFGRAVGETMIVLMATGNTPIMDWNPFNGFRTLSANIAVEIPEAPQHGTLYRVLFLSALILFALTFVANTIAEIVRQRVRKKYAQL